MAMAEHIKRIREMNGLSQEKFAETVGVSRQAVQKWESGASLPEIANITVIAKRFNVSADALLFGSDERLVDALTYDKKLQPKYETLHPYESYSGHLCLEYRQSCDEGRDLSGYEELFRQVEKMPAGEYKEQMSDVLFQLSLVAPKRADYPYVEPSDFDGIMQQAAKEQPRIARPAKEEMRRRLRGAWYGRIAGCLLGKPVEGISSTELHTLLKKSGNFPMHRYIRSADITQEMIDQFSFRLEGRCYADRVDCAPSDDDTNYTVLAYELIKRYGKNFTPYDVSRLRMDMQPKNAYCTAERVAFVNFVKGFTPPDSAVYKNVYREYIGAQIRGDYFGYINPGDPAKAAEMAFRDASISHIKNGIYGEMFVAGMLAMAAVNDNIEEILRAGLNVIPQKSRLVESVERVIEWYHAGDTAETVFARIHEQWNEKNGFDWCHTISNAMIVSAALLYGGGDYGKSICMAVETGFDTDCNGATVGSIIGMAKGIEAIAPEWLAPLQGKLKTNLFGVDIVSVDEMVERTLLQIEQE